PDEVQPIGRAGARGVEEVPVATHLVRPVETRRELAPTIVVEERRLLWPSRQRAFLEPDHEDDLEPARARAEQIEDGASPRLADAGEPDLGPLERGDQLVTRHRLAELVELVEQTLRRLVRPEVEPGRLPGGRRLRAVRGPQHRSDQG